MSQIVTVKLQRPIMSNSSMQEVMSYVIDEDGNQVSNSWVDEMPQEDIDLIFGDNYKVYYFGKYQEGKPVEIFLKSPAREDEWV